ncbi:MAG: hypothetical protein VW271_07335 [Chloroflexota bacterium]
MYSSSFEKSLASASTRTREPSSSMLVSRMSSVVNAEMIVTRRGYGYVYLPDGESTAA